MHLTVFVRLQNSLAACDMSFFNWSLFLIVNSKLSLNGRLFVHKLQASSIQAVSFEYVFG